MKNPSMENNIQNNIRWGQSFNLSVEMARGKDATKFNSEGVEEVIENIKAWQRWFFEELGKKPPEVCESCGGVSVYGGEPIVAGLHPKCRTSEGFKQKNL